MYAEGGGFGKGGGGDRDHFSVTVLRSLNFQEGKSVTPPAGLPVPPRSAHKLDLSSIVSSPGTCRKPDLVLLDIFAGC